MPVVSSAWDGTGRGVISDVQSRYRISRWAEPKGLVWVGKANQGWHLEGCEQGVEREVLNGLMSVCTGAVQHEIGRGPR